MEVLFLTVFLSLSLAAFFVFSFLQSRKVDSCSCPESDSLLPLKEDKADSVES